VSPLYDFYSLLPALLRLRDKFYSGASETEEGVLEKVVSLLEEQAQEITEDTDRLYDEFSIDTCAENLIPYLAQLFGAEFDSGWSASKRRAFVGSIIWLYKIKGQRLSWEALLRQYGHGGFFPWELWKQQLYETDQYTLEPDGYSSIKSARVDLRKADETYLWLGSPAWLETVRPIHVLVRTLVQSSDEAVDTAPTSDDTESSAAEGVVVEALSVEDDDLVFASACAAWTCETTCQTACQSASCETGCEAGSCETDCEVFCETSCQISCEFECQTSCQATCESPCMVASQV
jgi:phage tail-like protein